MDIPAFVPPLGLLGVAPHNESLGPGALTDPNLVTWDETPRNGKTGPAADPMNPQGWSNARKALSLGIVCAGATCVTCTATVMVNAYPGIKYELHVSDEVAILGISLFTTGLAVGSLIFPPLSEFFGRRPVYLVAFGLFTLLGLPVSFADHFAVFGVFRFLTGVMGSAFLSIAGGSATDLYPPNATLMPLACFTFSTFLGPMAGPILSSVIAYNTNWRWIFWTCNMWSASTWLALYFGVPETFAPIILTRRAEKQRKQTGNSALFSVHEVVLREKSIPAAIRANSTKVIELLILEPMLMLLAFWSALLLGILYLLLAVFPIVFTEHHGFKMWQTGLSFSGLLVGMLVSLPVIPCFSRKYLETAAGNGGNAPPEARLPMAMVGAVLTPVSLFWFAYTTDSSVHWIVPIVASIPFGSASILIYTAIVSFITDAWRPVAASAVGTNVLLRSLFSAFFPLFSNQLYRKMGAVRATSLLAGLNVLILPIPFLFYAYGARLRAKSRYTYTA